MAPAAAQLMAAPPANATSSADLETVKLAIELVRKRQPNEATELKKSIRDPAAQKLVEWAILRSEDSSPILTATRRSSATIPAG